MHSIYSDSAGNYQNFKLYEGYYCASKYVHYLLEMLINGRMRKYKGSGGGINQSGMYVWVENLLARHDLRRYAGGSSIDSGQCLSAFTGLGGSVGEGITEWGARIKVEGPAWGGP